MKNLLLNSALFLTFSFATAQKIYSVDYANQADVKIFVVKYENQADLKVFKVKYENQASGNEGKWFLQNIQIKRRQKYFL